MASYDDSKGYTSEPPPSRPKGDAGWDAFAKFHAQLFRWELRFRGVSVTSAGVPHRVGQVIVHQADLDRAKQDLQECDIKVGEETPGLPGDRALLFLKATAADLPLAERAVKLLRGSQVSAWLNHVFFGQSFRGSPAYLGNPAYFGNPAQFGNPAYFGNPNISTAAPASKPGEWPDRKPVEGGPIVAVLDTGLATSEADGVRRAAHPDLIPVTVHRPWDRDEVFRPGIVMRGADEDLVDENRDRYLDRQAGHGTFIAGIVRRLAPAAHIQIEGCLSSFGDGDDASISASIQALRERLAKAKRSLSDVVINMSFGGFTDGDEPPPLLTTEIEALAREGAVVVAAAGNSNSCRRVWPAAHPDVVGVGALDCTERAWFSNFGSWVDACASGVDVVSTFFDGNFGADMVDESHPDHYQGFARWSGTSFAAPKVAAAIADRMHRSRITAQAAATEVVYQPGLFRIPDLGTVINLV